MNKFKLYFATVSRAFLNVFLVIAAITLASLIGVGGAALWIYGCPAATQASVSHGTAQPKADLAASDESTFPKLTPVQADDESPVQLTPARYSPTASEIATISDTPRYTYISYNGGRQQAHLRVNTVVSTSVPAPLAPATASDDNDAAPALVSDRNPLSDPASHYITDAQGRVIGIDGTAGAASETEASQVNVPRALPVQPKGFEPEVRVAAPVVTRKAMPVDGDESVIPQAGAFSVQSELSRDDERPALRAIPVASSTRSKRPSMFGASDDLRSFGSN